MGPEKQTLPAFDVRCGVYFKKYVYTVVLGILSIACLIHLRSQSSVLILNKALCVQLYTGHSTNMKYL